MQIKIVTYDGMANRLDATEKLVKELNEAGYSVQIVHASFDSARRLEQELKLPVMSGHDFEFTPVEANCILFIDGDIMTERTAEKLQKSDKHIVVLMPSQALPPIAPDFDILRSERQKLYPRQTLDDEYPRTFACHHYAETCSSCESMVVMWKAKRRDDAVLKLAQLAQENS